MLSDLYRRFGSWSSPWPRTTWATAGSMSVVRRYNTNDYWTLSRLEAALPWETVLYVPKIVAAAVVGRNLAAFGLGGGRPRSADRGGRACASRRDAAPGRGVGGGLHAQGGRGAQPRAARRTHAPRAAGASGEERATR